MADIRPAHLQQAQHPFTAGLRLPSTVSSPDQLGTDPQAKDLPNLSQLVTYWRYRSVTYQADKPVIASHPLGETDGSERVSPLGLLQYKRWSCNHYSLLYLLLTDSSFVLRKAGKESADHSQPRQGRAPWEAATHLLTHSHPKQKGKSFSPPLQLTHTQLALFWQVFLPLLTTLPNIFRLKFVFNRCRMLALAFHVGDFQKLLLCPLILPHAVASC